MFYLYYQSVRLILYIRESHTGTRVDFKSQRKTFPTSPFTSNNLLVI